LDLEPWVCQNSWAIAQAEEPAESLKSRGTAISPRHDTIIIQTEFSKWHLLGTNRLNSPALHRYIPYQNATKRRSGRCQNAKRSVVCDAAYRFIPANIQSAAPYGFHQSHSNVGPEVACVLVEPEAYRYLEVDSVVSC
jgi:hypothetical protein